MSESPSGLCQVAVPALTEQTKDMLCSLFVLMSLVEYGEAGNDIITPSNYKVLTMSAHKHCVPFNVMLHAADIYVSVAHVNQPLVFPAPLHLF